MQCLGQVGFRGDAHGHRAFDVSPDESEVDLTGILASEPEVAVPPATGGGHESDLRIGPLPLPRRGARLGQGQLEQAAGHHPQTGLLRLDHLDH